ncbi:MAG: response regulator [Bacteroidales bacterium]|nr:response regulator [Bacteroidales bacterium]
MVDDEPMVREGLKLALELEGFRTTTASSGMEALKVLRSHKPHLIITDIIMPDSDGIEVICTVREKNPEIKIIAISGGGRISASDHLRVAYQLGANGILAKPFTTEQLICEINRLLTA